jgi:hypothetical protein
MKSRTQTIGILLLTGLLVFTGCFNALTAPETAAPGETGTVEILIGGAGAARNFAPKVSDFDDIDLVFHQYTGGGTQVVNSVEKKDLTGDYHQVVLDPGLWTVTATASKAGKPSIMGTYPNSTPTPYAATATPGAFEVKAGVTTQIPIVLFYGANADVPGTLTYSVSVPEEISDLPSYSQSFTLTPVTTANVASPGTSPGVINLVEDVGIESGTVSLPAGLYTLAINLDSGRSIAVTGGLYNESETLEVYRQEAVYIYPGLTTTATFVFNEEDFTAYEYLYGRIDLYDYSDGDPYEVTNVRFTSSGSANSWDTNDVNDPEATLSLPLPTAAAGADKSYNWELIVPSHELATNLTDSTTISYVVTFTSGTKELKNEVVQTANINRLQGNFGDTSGRLITYAPRIYTIDFPADGSIIRSGAPMRRPATYAIPNSIYDYESAPGHKDTVNGNTVYVHAKPEVVSKGYDVSRQFTLTYTSGATNTITGSTPYTALDNNLPTSDLNAVKGHYNFTAPSITFASTVANKKLTPVEPFYEFTGTLAVTTPNGYNRAQVSVISAAGDTIGTSAVYNIPAGGTASSIPWSTPVATSFAYSTGNVYYNTVFTDTTNTNPPLYVMDPSPNTYASYSTSGKTLYWASLTPPAPIPLTPGAASTTGTVTTTSKTLYSFQVTAVDAYTLKAANITTGQVKVTVWVDNVLQSAAGAAALTAAGYDIDYVSTTRNVLVLVEQLGPTVGGGNYTIGYN